MPSSAEAEARASPTHRPRRGLLGACPDRRVRGVPRMATHRGHNLLKRRQCSSYGSTGLRVWLIVAIQKVTQDFIQEHHLQKPQSPPRSAPFAGKEYASRRVGTAVGNPTPAAVLKRQMGHWAVQIALLSFGFCGHPAAVGRRYESASAFETTADSSSSLTISVRMSLTGVAMPNTLPQRAT